MDTAPAITSRHVATVTFAKEANGYNREHVDAFCRDLAAVLAEHETLAAEAVHAEALRVHAATIAQAEERAAALLAQADRDRAQMLGDAQTEADTLRTRGQETYQATVAQAQAEAARILTDARAEADRARAALESDAEPTRTGGPEAVAALRGAQATIAAALELLEGAAPTGAAATPLPETPVVETEDVPVTTAETAEGDVAPFGFLTQQPDATDVAPGYGM